MASRLRASRILVAVPILFLAGCAGGLPPQPATPQRPSFSSDTGTVARNTFEVEVGLAVDDQDGLDTPVAAKWGATEATELFLGFSPYLRVDGGADDPSGAGDLVAGGRVRFLEEKGGRPSAAIQFAAKLPSADEAEGLGTGEVDAFGAGILTKTIDLTTLVGYYQLGVLGEPAATGVDLEHGLAVAVAHPLAGDLGGFVEVAGVFTPDQDSEAVFTTIGLGYSASASIVLDAAVAIGLSNDAGDFSATIGATANLGSIPR